MSRHSVLALLTTSVSHEQPPSVTPQNPPPPSQSAAVRRLRAANSCSTTPPLILRHKLGQPDTPLPGHRTPGRRTVPRGAIVVTRTRYCGNEKRAAPICGARRSSAPLWAGDFWKTSVKTNHPTRSNETACTCSLVAGGVPRRQPAGHLPARAAIFLGVDFSANYPLQLHGEQAGAVVRGR